jgi:hypothetical protein
MLFTFEITCLFPLKLPANAVFESRANRIEELIIFFDTGFSLFED